MRPLPLCAPLTCVCELAHDLVLQVPRQDEDLIGLRLGDPLGRVHRDVRTRQEAPVLIGVAIHRVLQQIRADSAVVEQGVALGRGAITHDLLAIALAAEQEGQEVVLDLVSDVLEAAVVAHVQHPGGGFLRQQVGNCRGFVSRGLGMADP